VALAEAAIQAGFGAYFMTARDLVTDLGRAYREGRLDRRIRVYLAPRVLIVNEMGYLPLDDLRATAFFQLISARYERGSIILTSNKASVIGIPCSEIPSSQLRFWTGYCILTTNPRRELSPEGSSTCRPASASGTGRRLGLRFAQNAPKKRRWAPLRPRLRKNHSENEMRG